MAPDLLPGPRAQTDEAARAAFAQAAGWSAPDEPGTAFDAFWSGGMRALYVMGEDVVGGANDPAAMRAALAGAELVIVQDIFMNATAEVADVVLPGATFAEKSGHFTNFEGRLGRLEQAVNGVGEARPDWEIVARLAAALGRDFGWRSADPISAELERVAVATEVAGTRELVQVDGAMRPTADGAFVLATEQHLYTAGVTGRFAPSFTVMLPDAVAELNPGDAERLAIADGDAITLASQAGEVNLKALVSRRVPAGVVSLPDRFLEASPRRLDPRAPDGIDVRVSKR